MGIPNTSKLVAGVLSEAQRLSGARLGRGTTQRAVDAAPFLRRARPNTPDRVPYRGSLDQAVAAVMKLNTERKIRSLRNLG